MIHPAMRLLVWAAAVVFVQTLSGRPLAAALALAAGAAIALDAHRLLRLLRRMRWLVLAIALIFLWATPGVYLMPDLAAASPTREGLELAANHVGRLLAVVCLLALLLASTAVPALVSGLYSLMAPLQWLALDRARVAVRLMLVLELAQAPPQEGWRSWLDAPSDVTDAGSVTLELARFGMVDALVAVALCGALACGVVR